MVQVTELKSLSGGRYLVVTEEEITFPLYRKELDEFHISEGSYLSDEELNEIFTQCLSKRAKLCAMHYLERMDRTEHQLRTKLMSLFYPDEIITQAVQYMKQYHYIDDLRYAVNYIEYRMRQKSLRQLEQELLLKGISRDIFQEALTKIELPDEVDQIKHLLEKKHYEELADNPKERDRILRFLLRRGYSMRSIQAAINF